MGTKSVKKAFCVDHWILENNGYEYQNKRSEIIQEYLYDGKGVDLSEFDIRNYDIDLLCNIACCGLDTEDGVDVRTINEHIKKISSDSELEEDSTIRNFRIVQTEGSRQVSRQVKHYNLQMIIAVGFKVNNDRAVQFRKWANTIVKDYTTPGRQFTGASSHDPEVRRNPSLALDYIVAPPRMAHYIDWSTRVYSVYLKHVAPEDIYPYSIDEVFIDATSYLQTYHLSAREFARKIILDILQTTGITAAAGIGTNLYLAKVAMDIGAKHVPADEYGVRIAELDEMGYKVSADTCDKLQRIREAAERGEFDIFLVFMYDRLGRNLNETPFIAKWFTKKGIHVWSVYEGEIIDAVDAERMLDYIRFWQTDEAQKL